MQNLSSGDRVSLFLPYSILPNQVCMFQNDAAGKVLALSTVEQSEHSIGQPLGSAWQSEYLCIESSSGDVMASSRTFGCFRECFAKLIESCRA